MGLSLCSADSLLCSFKVLHLVFWGNNNASCFEFIATATATANPPMQNSKSAKTLFTCDVQKIQYSGWGLP